METKESADLSSSSCSGGDREGVRVSSFDWTFRGAGSHLGVDTHRRRGEAGKLGKVGLGEDHPDGMNYRV